MKSYKSEEIRSLISLFKVAPIPHQMNLNIDFVSCARNGFIFLNEDGDIVRKVPDRYFDYVVSEYGTAAFECNQTFYKSFKTVRDISPEQHLADQLMHYFSTYDLESFGLQAQPWVPIQEFHIDGWSAMTDKLVVIRLVSDESITELINKFAANTVAPSPRIIVEFNSLMKHITIPTDEIKSFELQVIKHDMDGTVPQNPISFLRYLVYKTTGQTLIIKNQKLCNAIKNGSNYGEICKIVEQIFAKGNETQLASIFLRYKPIFLAYKAYPGCRSKINRLRRLADKYHKPLSDTSVQNVTKLISEDRFVAVQEVINKASNRELIKLLNAINLHFVTNNTPGVYSIRNGRTFVKEDGYKLTKATDLPRFLKGRGMIEGELCQRLGANLMGRRFYLPKYIDYAVPVTEKQFTGNIPWGTKITATPNEPFTAGVCWFDQKGMRVDIDLHLNSATEHFGWNSGWRDDSDILYTGDQSSAPEPNGAAEAYWFNPEKGDFIMGVNLYSGPQNTEYKMFMTKTKPSNMSRNYTYDASSTLFPPIPMNFRDEHQQNLGLFTKDGFYFYGGAISSGIVPTANYEQFIGGLKSKLERSYMMSEFLRNLGAVVVDEIDENDDDIIDLSPETLTATTLLDIVDGNL